MTVKTNTFMCANISMIWAKTEMGDKNYQKISSTQLDSHTNMEVVVKQAQIIQRSGESFKITHY